MPTYFLYFHDRRYSVPTLEAVTVGGDDRAREVAAERLAASPHCFAAEIWDDDRLVAKLDKAGGQPAPA